MFVLFSTFVFVFFLPEGSRENLLHDITTAEEQWNVWRKEKVKLGRPDNLLPPGEGLQCIIACQTLKASITIQLLVCYATLLSYMKRFFYAVTLKLYILLHSTTKFNVEWEHLYKSISKIRCLSEHFKEIETVFPFFILAFPRYPFSHM